MNQTSGKEAKVKERRHSESKALKKSSQHSGDASSWDADAFNEKVRTSKDGKWKGGSSEKKASRVQDISMSLSSTHEAPPPAKNESWPFDSSPCRMFGGKNTKKENDATNKELFKTEFGEIKKESKTDSDSSDDSDSNDNDDDDNDDDASEEDDKSFGDESEEVEVEVEVEVFEDQDESADEGAEEEKAAPKQEKTFKRGPKSKERSSMNSFNRSNRSLESTGNKSQESRSSQRPQRRALKRSDSDRRLKPTKKDELAASSCHPSIEFKSNRRASRKSSGTLSAATHHGGDKPKKSRHLSRIKSSDGLEGMRHSARDDLGTASFHGGDRRLRSSKKSSSSDRKSKPGRLTRAMSTRNVKRPEEYSSNNNSNSNSNSTGPAASSAKTEETAVSRQRTVAPVVTPHDTNNTSSTSKKASRSMSREKNRSMSREKNRSMSREKPRLERKNSQRSIRSKDRSVGEKPSGSSKSHRSKSSSRPEESESEASAMMDAETKRKLRSSKRGSSHGEAPIRTPSQARPAQEEKEQTPRRDLLVLLREQKTVQPADLMDKENRRLLHFLVYEHRMGISLKELRRSVSADA